MGDYADDAVDYALNGAYWLDGAYWPDDDTDDDWAPYSRRRRRGYRAEPGSPLAKARMAAHAAFDPLWQDDDVGMDRGEAYGWLAKQLGIPKRDCHMLYFDEATCRRVEVICMRHRFLNA